jgi:D-beta-D-heptose 7-phosphate kinase/D-beta-D-heptose 1-phosphate adenosyltransferase
MIPDFSPARVLVLGDLMLDRYWQGSTARISPEAPVPVVSIEEQSARIGGAGNVAMNVTSLGASARLFGVIGTDEQGRELAGLLAATGIQEHCLRLAGIPTTTKLRVLSLHQQLIRLDFEQPHHDLELDPLLADYRASLAEVDVVILSDYGKGVLAQPRAFIEAARAQGRPVLVDPKREDFSDYAGATLLTPNRREFEAVVGPWRDDAQLEERARAVISRQGLEALLITRGGEGMTLVPGQGPARHFPAHAREVYDVTGAGDTVIATVATALGSGLPLEQAVEIAGKAAAIVVGRVGTSSVTVEDLARWERDDDRRPAGSGSAGKLLTESALLEQVDRWRAQGRRLVFTNGCFDVLHSGHVQYLEQAAALGDVLIVAVNSDDSVRRLKGASRPVNRLRDRMRLLAGLASVDAVVAFEEDTPERLVCAIGPDILAKGGDYRVEQIAGRQCAGEVKLIDFVEGQSTTAILQRIREPGD